MQLTGLDLAARYHDEVVAPLLLARWPGLRYAAGRLGSGSDVLGLDDATSRDHDWGLRMTLLVDRALVDEIDRYLEERLPDTCLGMPVRFTTTWDPVARHRVEVATPEGFARSRLGVDASDPLGVSEWLALTGQAVLEVVAGRMFVDMHGGITDIRRRLEWYPDDLWRYIIAADWARIGQELPFLGRTGQRGDDLGSGVLTARFVSTAMHLGFVLERRWPPYVKWVGTMFAALPSAGAAAPALRTALAADTWQRREASVVDALSILHDLQRNVGLPVADAVVEPFWDRPFQSLRPIAELLLSSIVDPEVRALPAGVGSVEQWVDSVPMLVDPARRVAAASAPRLPRTAEGIAHPTGSAVPI